MDRTLALLMLFAAELAAFLVGYTLGQIVHG